MTPTTYRCFQGNFLHRGAKLVKTVGQSFSQSISGLENFAAPYDKNFSVINQPIKVQRPESELRGERLSQQPLLGYYSLRQISRHMT